MAVKIEHILPSPALQGFWTPPSSITIAGGVITLTTEMCYLIIDTEGGAAADNLDTITMPGVQDGQRILCRSLHDARSPIFTQTDNIDLTFGSISIALNDTSEWMGFVYNGGTTKWELYTHLSNRS